MVKSHLSISRVLVKGLETIPLMSLEIKFVIEVRKHNHVNDKSVSLYIIQSTPMADGL